MDTFDLYSGLFSLEVYCKQCSFSLPCSSMNEARRLGTCTDTLTRRDKNDSLALSSTATTYIGFSVLPRSINIKSECAAFSIFVCMCASINTRKALNCEALSGTSLMEERYHNIYLH